MSYASVQDMVDAFGETEMIRLSTPQGAELSGIDTDRVETALEKASGLIDSHLRRRYACPLPVTPPEVNDACLTLARYSLSFGGDVEPSEQTRLARKEVIEWLGRLNSGSVSLEGVELASTVVGARTQDRRTPARGYGYGGMHPPGSGLGSFSGGFGLWE